jgi:carboxylesterase type B
MQEYDTTFSGFSGSEMWNPPHGVNEDCLYMNMWIPVTQEQDDVLYRQEVLNKLEDTNKINFIKTAFKSTSSSSNSNNMKPSLFWVYGGSFNSGSSNLRINEGTIISALENVIILTSNYRTGPFGFLYLNSTRAPGNMGVADQIMAIEWYKENYLTYFGGSYNDMCLFGESAGAMSLHLLLLSNKNHIFNRAIFQSSSSYLDTSYRSKYDAYKLSLSFAEKVGCIKTSSSASAPNSNNSTNFSQLFKQSSNALKIKFNKNYFNKYNHYSDYYFNELNDDDIVNCLMKLNSSYLSLKQFDLDYVNEYLKMQFLPIADYNFNNLKIDDPFDEFIFNINNNFKKYTHDILVGINQNEGTYFTFYLYNNKYFDLNGFYKYYSQQQQQPSGNNNNNNNNSDTILYNNDFVAQRLHESLRTKQPYDASNTNDNNKAINDYFYDKYVKCISKLYTKKFINDYYNETNDYDLDSNNNKKQNSAQLAWQKFNKIIGDFIFSCPSIKLANKYSEINPNKTFFYKFNKRSFANPWPKWTGVMHGYEIEYIFGMPFLNYDKFGNDDRLVSKRMMNYWANFAKFGKL